ncbi:MAG: hypothetical protein ABSE81_00735 [Candidatus Omnitrophota bacterium]
MKKIDCNKCSQMSHCCQTGSWADLEEAKKILELGLKGEFYHLEKDPDFPSGYRIGTCIGCSPCTFLTPDGLCSIHIVDYNLKPAMCKEFPYEKGKLAPFVNELCIMHKKDKKKKSKKTSR